MPHIITVVGQGGTANKRTFHKASAAEHFFNAHRRLPHVTFIQWLQPDGSLWGFLPRQGKPSVFRLNTDIS